MLSMDIEEFLLPRSRDDSSWKDISLFPIFLSTPTIWVQQSICGWWKYYRSCKQYISNELNLLYSQFITSASIMKVETAGLQNSLIMFIKSGNLAVVSFICREKTFTDPSASLWIWARWPSYLWENRTESKRLLITMSRQSCWVKLIIRFNHFNNT